MSQPTQMEKPRPFGVTRPTMTQARRLCEMVEGIDFREVAWFDDLDEVSFAARQMGAHSVARAVEWAWSTMGNEGVNNSDVEARLRAVATRWLHRMERTP